MISRMRVLLAVAWTILALFTGRLAWLQLAQEDQFRDLSQRNATEQRRIPPLRGRILARDGTVLAGNRVAYDLTYLGGPIEDWDRVARLLDLGGPPDPPDPTDAEEARNGAVAAWNVPDALVPALEERVAGHANLVLRERFERIYPTNLAAQAIGYTGLADPERHPGYAPDDMVGVMGLEAGLQDRLFGRPGVELVEVDNRGVAVRRQELVAPRPGRDVRTTLDVGAQRAAEDALRGAARYVNAYRAEEGLPALSTVRGALLAMDLETGDVLAMASAPTFDQNVFTHRPSDPDAVGAILADDDAKPLQNRAVQAYPPASTFKMVSSYALLEHGYVTPSTTHPCSPSVTYGGITWENWAPTYRGSYDVTDAIGDSCNTYYWHAALETPAFDDGWGPLAQHLHDDARAFGYGARVDVGLPEERRGRIPDPAWVRAEKDTAWYPGYTLNTMIGQGDVLATPLQTLRAAGAFANAGRQVEPRLVAEVGGVAEPVRSRTVPGTVWPTLAEGMRAMVTEFGSSEVIGPAAAFPLPVSGKTGTAQNAAGAGLEHAWFMAFAPSEAPEIAVVAFLENAGSSTRTAVPVVRDFLVDHLDLPVGVVEGGLRR